jgi:hypothetical protein
VARHPGGRPAEPVPQRRPQAFVVGQTGVVERLCEAELRPLVHLEVLAVARVQAQHTALVAHREV